MAVYHSYASPKPMLLNREQAAWRDEVKLLRSEGLKKQGAVYWADKKNSNLANLMPRLAP
jgi:hypothetical protein